MRLIDELYHRMWNAIGEYDDFVELTVDETKQILELLKAQEPKVMTREQVETLEENAVIWFESVSRKKTWPRIIDFVRDKTVAFTDGAVWRVDTDKYGLLWRCWTAKPTDEQKKAVKRDAAD